MSIIQTSGPVYPQPAVRESRVLAEYTDYEPAQRLVDHMSDSGFPVEHVRIIGDGLRSVEQVTGRLTRSRAALTGLGSGAWFGLFVGLLIGFFTVGNAWFGIILTGVLIGAFWGAALGFAMQWATGGRRDFSSVRAVVASRYIVEVDSSHAMDAERIAAGL